MDQEQAAPEVVVEKEVDSGEEIPQLKKTHTGWCGRFEAEEWYCRCGRKARQMRTRKRNHNEGRWFWSCPVREPRQQGDPEPCTFFLWFDEVDTAKEYMELNPTTPVAAPAPKPRDVRTPKNNGSKKIMTGWLTGTNGRKRSAKDISDEDPEEEEDKEDEEPFVIVDKNDDWEMFNQNNAYNGSPYRKAAKSNRSATPGQELQSNKEMEEGRNALPTPVTGSQNVDVRQSRARAVSPTPIQLDAAINLGDGREPAEGQTDVLTNILAWVRADFPGLKSSTAIMIEHEIEREAKRTQAEAKVYRRTIARLRQTVDDLETTVSHLTAGGAADDVVDLSD